MRSMTRTSFPRASTLFWGPPASVKRHDMDLPLQAIPTPSQAIPRPSQANAKQLVAKPQTQKWNICIAFEWTVSLAGLVTSAAAAGLNLRQKCLGLPRPPPPSPPPNLEAYTSAPAPLSAGRQVVPSSVLGWVGWHSNVAKLAGIQRAKPPCIFALSLHLSFWIIFLRSDGKKKNNTDSFSGKFNKDRGGKNCIIF